MSTRAANNFDIIRLTAAYGVLISHCWPLFGLEPEPIGHLMGFESLGFLCVNVFFFVSGFLVTQSFDRHAALRDFAIARLTRILPALAVSTILTAVVLGPIVSTLPVHDYFRDPRTWSYLGNALVFMPQFDLPGVFSTVPTPNSVNGSLWTLPLELAMYATLVGVLLAFGSARLPLIAFCCTLLLILLIGEAHQRWNWTRSGPIMLSGVPAWQFLRLGVFFFAGAVFARIHPRIPISPPLAVLASCLWLASFHTAAIFTTTLLCGTYLVYCFAFSPAIVRRLPRLQGDISYGVYLYAYPVQQCLAQSMLPLFGPLATAVAAIVATTVLAWLSWHAIESPALRFRNHLLTAGKDIGKRRDYENA